MNLLNHKFLLVLFFVALKTIAQPVDYQYYRPLENTSVGWHSIILPEELFVKLGSGYHEIRLFGIDEKGDTIEAPYLVFENLEQLKKQDYSFKKINESERNGNYYFTFDLNGYDESINSIRLDLQESNFDWKVNLEGSQDQVEWFKVLEGYRIISIKNELTDYTFTTLKFPDLKYRYLRMTILNPPKRPILNDAYFSFLTTETGKTKSVNIRKSSIEVDKKNKETVIDIDLDKALPVSHLSLKVGSEYDYYRPISIVCITDSVETPAGWKYAYKNILHSTLSSLEDKSFSFDPVITSKIKVIISNQDNPSLEVTEVQLERNVVELVTRITESGDYRMYYGLSNARRPSYDIELFKDKIPDELGQISLGGEVPIKSEPATEKSLIKNEIWLWVIICVVIVLLGGFSLKMLKQG